MTIYELKELLEYEISQGRGDYKVVTWSDHRSDATDTLRDSKAKEFYICTDE